MKSRKPCFGPPRRPCSLCGMPPVPPPMLPMEPPDCLPARGPLKIVSARETPDGKFDMVRFQNGMPGLIPHGYVFDGYGLRGNGPRYLDTHDIRGEISNSEGMDAPNLWFNNSDCGQNF